MEYICQNWRTGILYGEYEGEQMANITRLATGFLPFAGGNGQGAVSRFSTDEPSIDGLAGDGWILDGGTDQHDSRRQLIGIARLAAEGESLREGHNVEYFSLESRSLL